MDIFTETAQHFEKQAFEFTITEVLVLLEEVSRRYRLVLSEHLPHTLLSNITFYHVKRIHELHRDYGDTAKTTLKTAGWAFRSIRLMLNPVNAIIAETKGKIQGAITEELGDKLIFNLKRALLQEVASVCIDLYSGRFTTQTPQTSRVSQQDETRLAHHLEPLRVVIVGQISSGKSSLVNALLQDTLAEVDLLPSTDRITAYQLGIEGEASLRLIDMKGLSHDNQVLDETLSEITQADLVIWVLKANQSARTLDRQLKEKIEQFYQAKENISRKQPTIIGVLTHIDQLLPKAQQTSYQLSPPVTEKEKTIIEAMTYNQQLLRFSTIIPMAVQQPNSAFGVETLTEEIAKCYATAKQTQLNRQRHDLTQQEVSWLDEGKRLFKGLGKIVKRSVVSS
jgi:predicted GTPase